jgi:hypothetical protein
MHEQAISIGTVLERSGKDVYPTAAQELLIDPQWIATS